MSIDTDIPEELRQVVRTAWDILELFDRSSSLAKSLHSRLHAYLQIHRGMRKWLLPCGPGFAPPGMQAASPVARVRLGHRLRRITGR